MKTNKVYLRNHAAKYICDQAIDSLPQEIEDLATEINIALEKERFVKFKAQECTLYYDHKHKGFWLEPPYSTVVYNSTEQICTELSKKLKLAFRRPTFDELNESHAQAYMIAVLRFVEGTYVYNGEHNNNYCCLWSKSNTTNGNNNSQAYLLPFAPLNQSLLKLIEQGWIVPDGNTANSLQNLCKAYQQLLWEQKALLLDQKLSSDALKNYFSSKDHNQSRLPKLDDLDFKDINKGLWEFYFAQKPDASEFKEFDLEEAWEARDPEQDLAEHPVAIDFGTSSTVVAFRDNNGKKKLLRIGLKDYWQEIEEAHFENPTILQFHNYQNLAKALKGCYYRPDTEWCDAICSHEAKDNLKNNNNSSKIVYTVLTKLKPWAMRNAKKSPIRLIDNAKLEFEIANHNPAKRKEFDKATFDPIEFYAYLLGLVINSRLNGLHLKYYLTFPIKYPPAVKENILKSFERGLERSLPENLTFSSRFGKEFEVAQIASEPVAYAACAIKEYSLHKRAKTYYSVFDFGGGTTDFAYGLYREANNDEQNLDGLEYMIEHYWASGDNYLGGEYVLENLAYLAFKSEDNLKICRDNRIVFDLPEGAEEFSGSELLLDDSSASRANMTMMANNLRKFWENIGCKKTDQPDIANKDIANFMNSDGEMICDVKKGEIDNSAIFFNFNEDELKEWVYQRILQGVTAFFDAMEQAFIGKLKKEDTVHIFLAGNSSRSIVVQEIFKALASVNNAESEEITLGNLDEHFQEWLKKNVSKEQIKNLHYNLELHMPLIAEDKDPYKPTCKTGIALGLLDLVPGQPIDIIDKQRKKAGTATEAPFQFFVGKYTRDKFIPYLKQNGKYNTWEDIGPVPGKAITIVYSESPTAADGDLERENSLLKEKVIHFSQDTKGKRCFIMSLEHNKIKVALSRSKEDIVSGEINEIELN